MSALHEADAVFPALITSYGLGFGVGQARSGTKIEEIAPEVGLTPIELARLVGAFAFRLLDEALPILERMNDDERAVFTMMLRADRARQS